MTEIATPVEQPTQELVRSLFDYKDGSLYWKLKLNTRIVVGSKAGSLDAYGYDCIKIKNKAYKAHRLIWLYFYGEMPKLIDHIDGNRNNNNLENLRKTSFCGNCQNSRKRKDNTSGIKGVNFHKLTKKWAVQISVNKQRKHIGLFEDVELAELVAIEARNLFHKEYANHGKHLNCNR